MSNRNDIVKRREQAFRIMEALSGVDEELLARSDGEGGNKAGLKTRRYGKPIYRYFGTWAAVLCLAVTGAAIWANLWYLGGGMDRMPNSSGGQGMYEEVTDIADMGGEGNQPNHSFGANSRVQQDGSKEEYGGSGQADGLRPDQQQNGLKEENNGSSQADDLTPERQPEPSEGKFVTEGTGLEAGWAKVTLEEAADKAAVGKYIPQDIPDGYRFESARWNAEKEQLSLCFQRGMDSIMLFVGKAEEGCETVDVGRPETYDVRLYEIPYAETVPEEYRESFLSPVFAWETFTQEIAESRMCVYGDAGDTDTPRGDFSILFSDGILVRFSGEGTAEQIWEMFSSMGL